jgi:anthranilate 1,2-dioxygenase large subunit
MRQLRVQSYFGVIFVTFSDEVEPLEKYLGPVFTGHLKRLFSKPIRILGYQRQRIHGNWKLYLENTRDTYHGSLLHEFQSTFGLSRVTQTGGVTMDDRHRHNLTWSKLGTDADSEFSALYKDNNVHESQLRLNEPGIVKFDNEWGDGISLAICSLFPNCTVHQITNSLAARQVRTFGPDEFELVFTLFGYEDDTAEQHEHRLLQANFVGPAGLVSMEDGEAIEITHRASTSERDGACSVIEMGGGGPITTRLEHRINDTPCRGFWSYYAELMGIEPEGAVR